MVRVVAQRLVHGRVVALHVLGRGAGLERSVGEGRRSRKSLLMIVTNVRLETVCRAGRLAYVGGVCAVLTFRVS